MEETAVASSSGASGGGLSGGKGIAKGGKSSSVPADVRKLSDHRAIEYDRMKSGIGELDRVLGGGLVNGSVVLLSAAPGAGKALALDTPLATPSGWTTMGEVKVGDMLFDEQGLPCSVVNMTEIMHNREVLEVCFDDGSNIVADAEHQWLVKSRSTRQARYNPTNPNRGAHFSNTGKVTKVGKEAFGYFVAPPHRQRGLLPEWLENEPEIATTQQISEKIYDHGHTNYSISNTKALQLPERELPIPPYIMGYWLGDGCITGKDAEKQGYATKIHTKATNFGVVKLRRALRECGVLNNKHVPEIYLRASEAQRRELLAGLLDSGGSACKVSSAEFYNCNKQLADSVHDLVSSLGYKAFIRSINGKPCSITFAAFDTSPFRLSEKADRWSPGGERAQCRYIVEVNKIDSVPVKCVEVDSPSHLYLAGKSMIPTHNSTISSQLIDILASKGNRCLYVAGEESGEQVRLRVDRLGLGSSDKIDITGETEIGRVCSRLVSGYDFAVIDSIQTMWDEDSTSAAGSVSIIKNVGQALVRTAKDSGVCLLVIGHVTKEGNLAGPQHLSHLVDAVISLEGEQSQGYRILRADKNRFGSTNEIGVFEMTHDGLIEVNNPTSVFLNEHEAGLTGVIVCPVIHGNRPVLTEIQALAEPIPDHATPARRALGIDKTRLDILVAILNQHSGMKLRLGSRNLYVQVSGGLKVPDPGVDLAVCLAVASAASGRPVKHGWAAFGEVALTGELRPAGQHERRVMEAQKLGWENVIGPKGASVNVKNLREALQRGLGEKVEREES